MSGRDLIVEAGEALWGERWQPGMARALNVRRDTVEDWRQGRAVPPRGIYRDLHRLCEQRLTRLSEMGGQLAAAGEVQGERP